MKCLDLNELVTWYRFGSIILTTKENNGCFVYEPEPNLQSLYTDGRLRNSIIWRIDDNWIFTHNPKLKLGVLYEHIQTR